MAKTASRRKRPIRSTKKPSRLSSGTATISGGEFSGACPGIPDTDEFTCTTGRESVLADVTVERQAHIIDIDWDAVVLPSFRIVGAGLLPLTSRDHR